MSDEKNGRADDVPAVKQTGSNNPFDNSDPFISQEIPPGVDRRTFLAREMNSKYKETSEAGLAVSLTLC